MFYTFEKVAFPHIRRATVYSSDYASARAEAARRLGGSFLLFCVLVEGGL